MEGNISGSIEAQGQVLAGAASRGKGGCERRMSMARGRWCACDVEEQEEARRTHDIERLGEATDKVEAQRGLETRRK
jgi:hypothetical protein